MFNPPIPGESLTREPKNAAYERPPEIDDPEDAILYHIETLTDDRRIKAMAMLLESGIDVRTLTEGLLRKAVFDGIHSIDVSLIIGPAIHEYIKTTADMIGLDYVEDFNEEDDQTDEKFQYVINSSRARKALAKARVSTVRSPDLGQETVQEGAPMEPSAGLPVEVTEEVAPAKGLMARKGV